MRALPRTPHTSPGLAIGCRAFVPVLVCSPHLPPFHLCISLPTTLRAQCSDRYLTSDLSFFGVGSKMACFYLGGAVKARGAASNARRCLHLHIAPNSKPLPRPGLHVAADGACGDHCRRW